MTRKLVGLGDANHTRHRPKRSATRYRSPLGTCPGPPCFSSVKFTATANGLLDSPYGNLAGTPGTMSIEQIGTLKTVGRAAADGFTAEFVTVEPGPL